MKKVFVALSTFAEYGQEPLNLLKGSGIDFVINPSGRRLNEKEIVEFGADSDGIVAGVEPYTSDVLNHLPRLKCISRCGVGIDNIEQNKAKEMGIQILNTPDPVVQPVAELTIGMMLDLLRHITWHTNSLRSRQWLKKGGRNLKGSVVGVIGLGRIGQRVAELLKGFEVTVIACDPYAKGGDIPLVALNELLKQSDIVSLHVSTNKNAPFIFGEKEMSAMKEGSILLNLSRGELVDENALYAALTSGHLGGAGLDVFAKEPYTGPLCGLDNVILTPHIATLTRESRLEMEKLAVKNLLKALS